MASLILLNIYSFRLNIFKKGTCKVLFEKKDTLSANFEGGGGGAPVDAPSAPLAPEDLYKKLFLRKQVL